MSHGSTTNALACIQIACFIYILTMHLLGISLAEVDQNDRRNFPFNLPVLSDLTKLEFDAPITFFAGDNGSGKSSLLEAIAIMSNAIAAGSHDIENDESLEDVKAFGDSLTPLWKQRPMRGLFLRAEDFFGFSKRLQQMKKDLTEDYADIQQEVSMNSEAAKHLAASPFAREMAGIKQLYGDGLNVHSHGESFLKFFKARLKPNSLNLLDEPDAPFSPTLQLAFASMLKMLSEDNAQFIIATHSPILLAFPGATIYAFEADGIVKRPYQELESIRLMKDFLDKPEQFLRYI